MRLPLPSPSLLFTDNVVVYRNGANVSPRSILRYSSCPARPTQNIGPLMYTMTLFQRLATAAGYDPAVGPGSSCLSSTASGQCVLPWMGGTKPVASIILVANGISFAIMMAILTTIGPVADYGTFGRRILFAATIICWASQYTCMALTCTSPFSHEVSFGTLNDAASS